MITLLITIGIIVLLMIVLTAFFVSTYNKLVKLREMVRNSRGQIATQVESRWDALTNLIQATKQYSTHESETLENIVKQRSSLSGNMTPEDFNKSEDMFQNSLGRLIAIAESYPDLKASEVYKQTMVSVDKYEKNVRLSRMSYNDTVTKYNQQIITIPTNIIASLMNFTQEPYFEASESKREMPSWE